MRPEKRKPVSSDAAVQAADPGEHMVTGDAAGLILRVRRAKNGVVTRTWIVRVSVNGRRRRDLALVDILPSASPEPVSWPRTPIAPRLKGMSPANAPNAVSRLPRPRASSRSARRSTAGSPRRRTPEQERQVRPDPRARAPHSFRSAAFARCRINHCRRCRWCPAKACPGNRGQTPHCYSRCLRLRHSDA